MIFCAASTFGSSVICVVCGGHSDDMNSISVGMNDAYCRICAIVMLASVVPTGTSNPLCTMPFSTVPNGEPEVQAITACGSALLICWICAATLTSLGLN